MQEVAIPRSVSMHLVDEEELSIFLARAAIKSADPMLGIGRELAYREQPARTLVVYPGATARDAARRATLRALVSIEERWLWIPRYGHGAIAFEAGVRADLVDQLTSHLADLIDIGDDIYLAGGSGDTLICFGHRMFEEGLGVYLRNVEKTGRLLTLLNERAIGVELFCRPD